MGRPKGARPIGKANLSRRNGLGDLDSPGTGLTEATDLVRELDPIAPPAAVRPSTSPGITAGGAPSTRLLRIDV